MRSFFYFTFSGLYTIIRLSDAKREGLMEQIEEKKRDYAVLVGLRSPVLRQDSADEESLA